MTNRSPMSNDAHDPNERLPGRSFQDHARPLGEALIESAAQTVAPTVETLESPLKQTTRQGAADRGGVAQRAKVISVLRKAEEFIHTTEAPDDEQATLRRALELASGRIGMTYQEYRVLTDADPELVQLEHEVLADAHRRWEHVRHSAPERDGVRTEIATATPGTRP